MLPRAPDGFVFTPAGRLRLMVREGAPEVGELLHRWARDDLPPARILPGGRGGVGAFLLRPDLGVVLRPYRRGGLIGRVNRGRYLGLAARPFRELRAAVAVAAAGVPTPEPLGAAVLWDAPGLYRGAFVTRELWGAANLWRFLQQAPAAQRGAACAAAAALVRRLHDAGALHPDLNLQNFLIRRGASGIDAWLIDLDGVRFTAVSARHRRAAFDRICRSIRKLDPESAVITLACVEAFQEVKDEG
ncbi:MAG TPA: lipopolysaccharide kinase InaA family protein [Candidatus Dormibacteraeota bacterium]|nr:lipopolysaccharide kinase InaA family protein [Candidatus Dormibacteraeota bacterium]